MTGGQETGGGTADERVALVTGASRGLGAAIAAALARDGLAVALNYRRGEAAATELREKITAAGGRAAAFRADVTDEHEVAGLHRRVLDAFGRLDVLVCNATGPQPDRPLEETRWPDVLDQLEFFVKSPLLLAREAVAGMKRRGYGRIVHVGSDVVALGPPMSGAYVAAKAAQLGLTRSWARELGPHGITVNFVAPGWIPTDRHAGMPAEATEEYAARLPLGHLGVPADVGEAVAFLASERAAFITGQTLTVNGGATFG
ncbi:SDR family oxidoreductase [Actinomadura vinacea]|uniref:SDR family oxidoreductase n=1 Tax=Actinomadura vinacea TaxID=115336 RepID=A0ABP5VV20_9ACTN